MNYSPNTNEHVDAKDYIQPSSETVSNDSETTSQNEESEVDEVEQPQFNKAGRRTTALKDLLLSKVSKDQEGDPSPMAEEISEREKTSENGEALDDRQPSENGQSLHEGQSEINSAGSDSISEQEFSGPEEAEPDYEKQPEFNKAGFRTTGGKDILENQYSRVEPRSTSPANEHRIEGGQLEYDEKGRPTTGGKDIELMRQLGMIPTDTTGVDNEGNDAAAADDDYQDPPAALKRQTPIPKDPPKYKKKAPRLDEIWSIQTFTAKSNKKEMLAILQQAGKDITRAPYNSMTGPELAKACHKEQVAYSNRKNNAPGTVSTSATQSTGTVLNSGSKRSREESGLDEPDQPPFPNVSQKGLKPLQQQGAQKFHRRSHSDTEGDQIPAPKKQKTGHAADEKAFQRSPRQKRPRDTSDDKEPDQGGPLKKQKTRNADFVPENNPRASRKRTLDESESDDITQDIPTKKAKIQDAVTLNAPEIFGRHETLLGLKAIKYAVRLDLAYGLDEAAQNTMNSALASCSVEAIANDEELNEDGIDLFNFGTVVWKDGELVISYAAQKIARELLEKKYEIMSLEPETDDDTKALNTVKKQARSLFKKLVTQVKKFIHGENVDLLAETGKIITEGLGIDENGEPQELEQRAEAEEEEEEDEQPPEGEEDNEANGESGETAENSEFEEGDLFEEGEAFEEGGEYEEGEEFEEGELVEEDELEEGELVEQHELVSEDEESEESEED